MARLEMAWRLQLQHAPGRVHLAVLVRAHVGARGRRGTRGGGARLRLHGVTGERRRGFRQTPPRRASIHPRSGARTLNRVPHYIDIVILL